MRDKDGLHTTREYYHQLDDLGRQEMRMYIRHKLTVYLTGVLAVGPTSVLLGVVYFRYPDLSQLAMVALGANTTGIFWRRYWFHRAILDYMRKFEDSR